MASWGQFAAAAPELAEFGATLFEAATPPSVRKPGSFNGYAYLATVRKDGGPRVHPVCPVMTGGHLYVAIPPTSPKLHDLRRDGRYVLHAPLSEEGDAEFAVRGRAREANDPGTRAAVVEAARGWTTIHDEEVIFAFDIEQADSTVWENAGRPDTRPIRKRWRDLGGRFDSPVAPA